MALVIRAKGLKLKTVLTLCSVMVLCTTSAQAIPVDSIAAFIAGIELLHLARDISDAEKVQRYRDLEALCGIKGPQVSAALEKYRDKPAAWKNVHEKVKEIVSQSDTVTAAVVVEPQE